MLQLLPVSLAWLDGDASSIPLHCSAPLVWWGRERGEVRGWRGGDPGSARGAKSEEEMRRVLRCCSATWPLSIRRGGYDRPAAGVAEQSSGGQPHPHPCHRCGRRKIGASLSPLPSQPSTGPPSSTQRTESIRHSPYTPGLAVSLSPSPYPLTLSILHPPLPRPPTV